MLWFTYYVILNQMFLYIYNMYISYFTNYSSKYLVKLTLSRHIHMFLVKNIENILRLFIDFWRACLLCINRNSWFVVHFTGYSTEEWLFWFTMWYSIKCFYTFITYIYIYKLLYKLFWQIFSEINSVKAHSMRLQFLVKNIAFAELDGFRSWKVWIFQSTLHNKFIMMVTAE